MRWLSFSLTLPLVLLIALGIWLIQGEHHRAREAARSEASQWVQIIAGMLDRAEPPTVRFARSVFDGQMKTDDALTESYENGITELRQGDSQKGKSILEELLTTPLDDAHTSSELPLKPLVLRALLDTNPNEFSKPLLEAAAKYPSSLSYRLAKDAAIHWQDAGLMKKAELASAAATVMEARRKSWTANSPWTTWHDDTWFADFAVSDDIRVTSLSFVRSWLKEQLQEVAADLPEAYALEVHWRDRLMTPSIEEHLAEKVSGHFDIAVSLRSPEAWKALLRQRYTWLGSLLAIAFLATAGALWAAWRAIQKQAALSALQADFLASVSHELRTPVASIGVLAERLVSGKGKVADEKSSQYHHFIARETKRLRALVDNILDFSRIEQGRKRYTLEPADLPKLVTETVELLRPRAEERSVTLETVINLSEATVTPDVDALALRQALVNLLDNAVKFSWEQSKVVTKLVSMGDSVQLSVTDQGPGIPASEQEKIFKRFYRVEQGLQRETRGAGIGLSIVKHIVEAHGARISVESFPNSDTTFTIIFPKQL